MKTGLASSRPAYGWHRCRPPRAEAVDVAAPALQRFYANLRRLRRRLLVFILPSAVALLIILGGELYPEWMRTYMMYLAPVALFALTVFAYSLLNTSEDLRAERAVNS